MERLCDALTTVGNDADPKLGMLAAHFVKSLRKNPPADEQIVATLTWLESVLTQILTGDAPAEDTPESPVIDTDTRAVEWPAELEAFVPVEEAATA